MSDTQHLDADCGCSKQKDRYVSFGGIDCNGNASLVMGMIERNLLEPRSSGRFWEYFFAKRKPASGPPPDDLFLVHCHLNQIRELFEECADDEALALLTQLEVECC